MNKEPKRVSVFIIVLALSPIAIFFVPFFWTGDILPMKLLRWLGYASVTVGVTSAAMLCFYGRIWPIIFGVLSLLLGIGIGFFLLSAHFMGVEGCRQTVARFAIQLSLILEMLRNFYRFTLVPSAGLQTGHENVLKFHGPIHRHSLRG